MQITKYPIITLILLLLTAHMLPDEAYARAGSGGSAGSRGTRTYQSSPSGASSLGRSNTTTPAQPAPRTGSFVPALAGGLLGAGIAHMLFGGNGSIGLLPVLILLGGAYFIIRALRNRQGNNVNTPRGYATPTQPLMLMQSDIMDFRQIFLNIQQAWSTEDIHALSRFATPEILHYFNEQLAANRSRGIINKMENINVAQIDQVEAWAEYNRDYATVIIKWVANDYDARMGRTPADVDYFASGNANIAGSFAEQWTFTRTENGQWLLSAIQQL